ncbi:MAG: hypothetical protein HYW02_04570 [Deltaproteobacteria bacterium]|nr:hypothetical protein [Deltaproteobacteria bacterium]MBI2500732.1 hypothetical protein [Deltaproteobacteria bacterium]
MISILATSAAPRVETERREESPILKYSAPLAVVLGQVLLFRGLPSFFGGHFKSLKQFQWYRTFLARHPELSVRRLTKAQIKAGESFIPKNVLERIDHDWEGIFANVAISTGIELAHQSWRGGEEGFVWEPEKWDLLPASYFILNNFAFGAGTKFFSNSRLYSWVVNGFRRGGPIQTINYGKDLNFIGLGPTTGSGVGGFLSRKVYCHPKNGLWHLWKCVAMNGLVSIGWAVSLIPVAWTTQSSDEKSWDYILWTAGVYAMTGGFRHAITHRFSPAPGTWGNYLLSDVTYTVQQLGVIIYKGAYA